MDDMAWLCVVDELNVDGERKPPPVPVDALAHRIRDDGGLAELPALALLDEIDRLRAELVAANQQWLVALRYACNELRRAVVAWEAIAPGECFESEEEGDVFHAAHKVLAAVDGGAQ